MNPDDIEQLIKYRLEQAQTALDDGKYLYDGERSTQSIVNRAYYAMFYATLALLQKISKIPSKHTGVISLFDTEFVLKGILPKELSKNFHKAFELRQKSDYKVVTTISQEKALETWQNAVTFVNTVRNYFGVVYEEIKEKLIVSDAFILKKIDDLLKNSNLPRDTTINLLEDVPIKYDLGTEKIEEEIEKICAQKISITSFLLLKRYYSERIKQKSCVRVELAHRFAKQTAISLLKKFEEINRIFITEYGSLYFSLDGNVSLRIILKNRKFAIKEIMQKQFLIDRKTQEKIKYDFANRLGSDHSIHNTPIPTISLQIEACPLEIGYFYDSGETSKGNLARFEEYDKYFILKDTVPNHLGHSIYEIIKNKDEASIIISLLDSEEYFDHYKEYSHPSNFLF